MGHTYFSISDEQHSIQCMLRNQHRDKAVYIVKNTMIDVFGSISVYEKDAKLQFMVDDVRVVELDDSSLDFSVLEKLKQRGLYPKNRRDLPTVPEQIDLITSKHSEALSDFRHVYKEQKGKANIQVLDAHVQGEFAARMIVERIQQSNRYKQADIIVLSRGGGRSDDLAVYNSFEVAEAICKSKIPVVTGIGHQRDETIADRVADQKTISPTDAAYKLARLSDSSESEPKVTSSPKTTNQPSQNMIIVAIGLTILLGLIVVILLMFQ